MNIVILIIGLVMTVLGLLFFKKGVSKFLSDLNRKERNLIVLIIDEILISDISFNLLLFFIGICLVLSGLGFFQ